MGSDVLQFLFCFPNAWNVACGNPPESLVSLRHFVEPAFSVTNQLHMKGFVNVLFQRFEVFPDTHIDQEQRIVKYTDGGCTAVILLETPYKPFRTIGESVYFVKT